MIFVIDETMTSQGTVTVNPGNFKSVGFFYFHLKTSILFPIETSMNSSRLLLPTIGTNAYPSKGI
jgi:hypothetical protein